MSDSDQTVLGRYQLVEMFAKGGMAQLYRAQATDQPDGAPPIAIKRILPRLADEEEFAEMFVNEARLMAQLSHPNIVEVYELVTAGQDLYIAMEYVDGIDVLTLARILADREECFPPSVAAHIVHEVLDALEYAHEALDEDGNKLGIVHRDVSPGNILLSRDGAVKVIDFGVAYATNHAHTKTGTLKGKYGYMSPEQVMGVPLDGRSDVFACGILLTEMLMGQRLFWSQSELDVLLMIREARLSRLKEHGANIDPALKRLVLRALQRDPGDRYMTAGAFRDAVGRWRDENQCTDGREELSALIAALIKPGHAAASPTCGPSSIQFAHVSTAEGTQPSIVIEAPRATGDERFANGPSTLVGRPDEMVTPGPVTDAPSTVTVHLRQLHALFAAAPPARSDMQICLSTEQRRILAEAREQAEIPAHDLSLPEIAEILEARGCDTAVELSTDDFARLAGQVTPDGSDAAAGSPSKPEVPGDAPTRQPDASGDLADISPFHTFYRLASARANGLLTVEREGRRKFVYFTDGVPQRVLSNIESERLGHYLVRNQLISESELAMVLAIQPRFGGQMADALVALGLLGALQAARALKGQLEDKIVDLCTWETGHFEWYNSYTGDLRDDHHLHPDLLGCLGRASQELSLERIMQWAHARQAMLPTPTSTPPFDLAALSLGTRPVDVLNLLGNCKRFGDLQDLLPVQRLFADALRTCFVLYQTECLTLTQG